MPRYYGGPEDFYQGTGFDPYTGRLQGGQLVMQIMNQIAGNKRRKQEEAWEVEDRDINKRYKEAQISNLYETKPVPEPKPTSKVSPLMLKSMMKRLDYPSEVIAEVDTMNEPALSQAWGKVQDDFSKRQLQGLKVPRTAATNKGRVQYQQLKAALDVVKARKRVPESALVQLLGDPNRAMLSADTITSLREEQARLEEQEGEIASMMNNIDETGELTEEQFKRLHVILKYRTSYKPYLGKPAPKTDAEKKLPEGFIIQK